MKKQLLALVIGSSLSTMTVPLSAKSNNVITQHDAQRFIIKFKNSFQHATERTTGYMLRPNEVDMLMVSEMRLQSLQKQGIKTHRALPYSYAISASLTKRQLTTLSKRSDIEFIEPDPVRLLQSEQRDYGVSMIQAPLLSDAATGDMKVCIVDTGYDINHPDLPSAANITGEIEVSAAGGQSDLGVWYEDTYGHGTHMAGTIAALGNNGIGLSGVNPSGNLNLHVVKILDNSNWWRAYGSDLVAAVDACVQQDADIINLSIGGHEQSIVEEMALQSAYNSGAIIVAAAGNMGSSDYYYPAAYDAVIAATAVDKKEAIWMFSHQHDQIELAAAGVEVKSTMRDGGYATWDGTSISSAIVSGGLALLWSHHQECTNTEIRNVAQISAKDLGTVGYDTQYGYGVLQVADASQLINDAGCDGILNHAPIIDATPKTWVSAGSVYSLTPIATDPEDDALTFSAENLPLWLTLDELSGEIQGQPSVDTSTQVFADIKITVSDGQNTAVLPDFSITVIESQLSEWSDNGTPHSFGSWTPEFANQADDFIQYRGYLQPQTRDELKQGLDEEGQLITLGSTITHQQDYSQTESRNINVVGEGWINIGNVHSCMEWMPAANTVKLGDTFTQTQDCQQDQIQEVTYFNAGTALLTQQVTQSAVVTAQKQAVGTMDYIIESNESCGGAVLQAKQYIHESFTPSCLDFTDDRFFTQTQPWTQESIKTCHLTHSWASGATTEEDEQRVEFINSGQDAQTVQGCQPFTGSWSSSELIGSTACAHSLEEQFPGSFTVPKVGQCTKRSEKYYHVDVIEVNSPLCEEFSGKNYVGMFLQTCED